GLLPVLDDAPEDESPDEEADRERRDDRPDPQVVHLVRLCRDPAGPAETAERPADVAPGQQRHHGGGTDAEAERSPYHRSCLLNPLIGRRVLDRAVARGLGVGLSNPRTTGRLSSRPPG